MDDLDTLSATTSIRLTLDQKQWVEAQAKAIRRDERWRATASDVMRRLIDAAMAAEQGEIADED